MSEQIIALIGAALLLAVVALTLLRMRRKSAETGDAAAAPADATDAQPADGAPLPDGAWQALAAIPGLSEAQATALLGAGIDSVAALGNCSRDEARLHELADSLGLEDFVLARWVGNADLLQLRGMTPELADALVRTGVRSRAALAAANPDRVQNKLAAAAGRREPPGPAPDRAAVVALIEAAAHS